MRWMLIAVVAGLSGCASLSQEECLAGNWRTIGYEDGAQGQPAERVGEHRQACERHGVSPNLELWRLGYDEGLVAYCTPDNGFRVGAAGGAYHGVCRGPQGDGFLAGLRDGQYFYDAKDHLAGLESDRARIGDEIGELQREADRLRGVIGDRDAPKDVRDAAAADLLEVGEDLGHLKTREDDLAYDIHRARDDVDAVRARMRSIYPGWSGY